MNLQSFQIIKASHPPIPVPSLSRTIGPYIICTQILVNLGNKETKYKPSCREELHLRVTSNKKKIQHDISVKFPK